MGSKYAYFLLEFLEFIQLGIHFCSFAFSWLAKVHVPWDH